MDLQLEERPTTSSYDERLSDSLDIFNYTQLTPQQELLIKASIEGSDVLGIMPTGSGKSACFQIPGLVTKELTLVISPLIALQEDQVRALRKLGIKAYALHHHMGEVEKNLVRYYLHTTKNEAVFLYISPEHFLSDEFQNGYKKVRFTRMAVDEAHCVSTWGDAFRPDYQRLAVAAARMGIRIISAFTATVDPKIERDIRRRLGLRDDYLKVEADPYRENLHLQVIKSADESATSRQRTKFLRVLDLLASKEYHGSAIIYFTSIKSVTTFYLAVRKNKEFRALTKYQPHLFHSQLPYDDKQSAVRGFKEDERPLICATTAFGMGMHRPDVRHIIHHQTPFTLIDYAQQIGRGGRDGKPTLCTTFHSTQGFLNREVHRVKVELPTYAYVEKTLEKLTTTLERLPSKARAHYNMQSFRHRMQRAFELYEQESRLTDLMTTRLNAALGILQSVGLIRETPEGLSVRPIEPGSKTQSALLERTQMFGRAALREREKVEQFFEHETPTQQRLWEILRQE
jgi:RecQ family ATP-dependent DNA helicase